MTNTAVAQLFSGGRFDEAKDRVAEQVEWQIYEEKMQLRGKAEVMDFCRSVAEYFKSITTNFEAYGLVADDTKVAIYGKAEFIRGGQTINTVHSCDIYEFDVDGNISRIYSYCNSRPAPEDN
jgi:hypothetical protein